MLKVTLHPSLPSSPAIGLSQFWSHRSHFAWIVLYGGRSSFRKTISNIQLHLHFCATHFTHWALPYNNTMSSAEEADVQKDRQKCPHWIYWSSMPLLDILGISWIFRYLLFWGQVFPHTCIYTKRQIINLDCRGWKYVDTLVPWSSWTWSTISQNCIGYSWHWI